MAGKNVKETYSTYYTPKPPKVQTHRIFYSNCATMISCPQLARRQAGLGAYIFAKKSALPLGVYKLDFEFSFARSYIGRIKQHIVQFIVCIW
jgi:hypothetical protein